MLRCVRLLLMVVLLQFLLMKMQIYGQIRDLLILWILNQFVLPALSIQTPDHPQFCDSG